MSNIDSSFTSNNNYENNHVMISQGGNKKAMKKILSVALSTAMAFSMFASVAFGQSGLTDVNAQYNYLKDKGIFTGYTDGQAHLDRNMTRAEFATVIARTLGLEQVTGVVSFKDKNYSANHWAAPYVEAVAKEGIMEGQNTTKKIFGLTSNVTVQEMATVLVRALKLEIPADSEINNTASAWAKGYVQAAINAGLVDANADFQSNATRALLVGAAYAMDQQVSVGVKSYNVTEAGKVVEFTMSDDQVVRVTLDQALEANKETAVKFTYNGKEYTHNVTYVVTAPAVESVSAINGKQIVVKFTVPVAPSTIVSDGKLVANKVTLNNTTDAAPLTTDATVEAELDSTEKELTITLKDGEQLAKNKNYTFSITGVSDANGTPIPHFATALTANESVAPAIKSAVATTKDTVTRTVTLTFTEPVVQPTVKVNGKFVGVAKVSDSVYTLTTTEDLEIDKSYEVEVIGLTDILGNAAENSLKSTVTVVRDTTKPTFTVNAVNEKTIDVVFDKEIDSTSIAVDSFKVTKVLSDGTTKQTIAQSGLGQLQTDKKTVRLTLSGNVFDNTTQTTREISVAVSGITDKVGNEVTAKTEKVTVTRDTVKPTVTSVTQVFNNATTLNVVFSEAVVGMGTGAGEVFTVVDANGNQVVVGGSAVTATVGTATSSLVDGQNKVTVTLSAALPSSGTYKLVAIQGKISDTANVANKNNAQSIEFAYSVPATTVGTLTATITNDKNGSASGTDLTDSEAANRVVYVEFNRADVVNGINASTGTYKDGAADNPANYTVDGAPLPEGTVVTFVAGSGTNDNKAGVTLNFSAVDEDDLPEALLEGGKLAVSVANVKATTGATLSYTTTQVVVADKTAPTVTAAYLSGNVTEKSLMLELTFSEDVDISNAAEEKLKLSYTNTAGSAGQEVVGDNSVAASYIGTAKNKVKIKLTQASALDIDLTKPVTLTVLADSLITDTATNDLAATATPITVEVFAQK